ncbi:MAG: hypothetical protein AMXMBFR47_08400 [Planctomycetota bacterium]
MESGVQPHADARGNGAGPPDWETLDVALACPGCGYNLFMLTESRCPECGIRLSWDALLAEARRPESERWLFEHCWRRRPLQSLAMTLGMTLMPWRLWRRVALTDRPNPTAAAVLLLSAMCVDLVAIFVFYVFEFRKLWAARSIGGAIDLALAALRHELPALLPAMVVPPIAFLLGMMVYRSSLLRRRILTGHLVRVVAFSWSGLLLLDAMIQIAAGLLAPDPRGASTGMGAILAWCVLAGFTIFSIAGGFGWYLGMPMAFLAAAASALLGLLIALAVVSSLSVLVEGVDGTLWLRVSESWIPNFDKLLGEFYRWWF